MTRRELASLLAVSALPLKADSASDAWNVIAALASDLADDNVPGFLKPMDAAMPGLEKLHASLRAMIAESDVHSTIEPVSNEGDDNRRTLELDWTLHMRRKASDEPRVEVRQQLVTVVMRLQGKKWVILEFGPVEFFAPPNFR